MTPHTAKKHHNVVVAHGFPLFRTGLVKTLSKYRFVKDITEAEKGKDLITILRRTDQDIVILDREYSDMDCFELLSRISTLPNTPAVIVISTTPTAFHLKRLHEWGIKGYLLQKSPLDELEKALKAVITGQVYFCQGVHNLLVNELLQNGPASKKAPALTQKETVVLKLICEELTTKEIASRLNLAAETVTRYRQILMEKTGSRNMIGMVRYAIRKGFLTE